MYKNERTSATKKYGIVLDWGVKKDSYLNYIPLISSSTQFAILNSVLKISVTLKRK